MEVAGPLGTPLGLAQRKRASPRGEAGTSGFLCVSDSDHRVPAELGQESQASSCKEEWNSACLSRDSGKHNRQIRSDQSLSCPTLCDPMNRSTPGLQVHHKLPEFTETHVHQVSDAIQPSHPLSSPSPLAPLYTKDPPRVTDHRPGKPMSPTSCRKDRASPAMSFSPPLSRFTTC